MAKIKKAMAQPLVEEEVKEAQETVEDTVSEADEVVEAAEAAEVPVVDEPKDIDEDKIVAPKKNDPIAIPGTTVTESQLKEWKAQYKRVFVTDYIDMRYVWHRMDRKLFNQVRKETESIEDDQELIYAREKEFCKRCCLYPAPEAVAEAVEDEETAYRIAQEIMFHSGFYPPQTTEV